MSKGDWCRPFNRELWRNNWEHIFGQEIKVKDKLMEILSDECHVNPRELEANVKMVDLGLDSLDFVDVVTCLEEEYGEIDLTDEEINSIAELDIFGLAHLLTEKTKGR